MRKRFHSLVTRAVHSASGTNTGGIRPRNKKDSPGYVRNWTEKVEIACANKPTHTPKHVQQGVDVDNTSCIEGSVIGGLLGAGLGAALSRDEGRWVGVPVGTAAGALVGCQVDGG